MIMTTTKPSPPERRVSFEDKALKEFESISIESLE